MLTLAVISADIPACGQSAIPAGAHSKPKMSDYAAASRGKLLVGRWESSLAGIEFLEGGGFAFFREGTFRVHRPGAYKLIAQDKLRMVRSTGTLTWMIKKLTKNELIVTVET